MQKALLIFNPRCSKSREAFEILEACSIDFDTIDYLKDGLKEKLLVHLPKLLNLSYSEMVRTKESLYKDLKLEGKNLSDKEWIQILIEHPVLLERPIFIKDEKAVIARPSQKVKDLI